MSTQLDERDPCVEGEPSDDGRVGLDDEEAVERLDGQPGIGQGELEGRVVDGDDPGAAGGEQLPLRPLGDDPPTADHDELVGDDLDLAEQVGREEHRAALVGEMAQQAAHPVDALGVEAVGRLVEDEDLGVAHERTGQPEPLTHAERVVAHAAAGLVVGEADEAEHLLDPALGHPHLQRGETEHLAAGPARVLGRGVEHDADVPTGVGQVAVGPTEDRRRPARRRRQAGHHPHRGRLAGPVGAEEAGDAARSGRERDVVHGGEAAVRLGEVLDLDHGFTMALRAPPGRRSTGWSWSDPGMNLESRTATWVAVGGRSACLQLPT